MQNDPDQATKPMGDGPDGLIVSEARDESTIDNLENGPFRLGCGVGTLIENASHVAGPFSGAGALWVPLASFLSNAPSRPKPCIASRAERCFRRSHPSHDLLFRIASP